MTVRVKLTELSKNLHVSLNDNTKNITAKIGEVQTVTLSDGKEIYKGQYIVTPKIEQQALPTKNKILTEDVTVKSIPFFDVSNNSGGNTVYIASEV